MFVGGWGQGEELQDLPKLSAVRAPISFSSVAMIKVGDCCGHSCMCSIW